MRWLFFLFISSFEFFPLPLSLLLVRLLLIFLLFPTLFLAAPVDHLPGLASFHLPLPPSHLSLWLLVLYVCGLSCLSWPFLLLFLHGGLLRVFLYLCTTISFPLSFFRLGVCARLWCLPLSSYLLTLPRPLRWFSLRGLPLCSS